MPLTEDQLQQRDASRNIGDELLQAICDVKARNYGTEYAVGRRKDEEFFKPLTMLCFVCSDELQG